jgi:glycosyltransferase involved in cell wall biosynthesis
VELSIAPWPRQAVQLAWCLRSGPGIERHLGHIDVAHLLQPFPPVKSKSPQIVTVHDLFPFEHPDWYPRSELWTYRRSVELAVGRARRITVPSTYVADRLEEQLGVERATVDVVPLGISGKFANGGAHDQVLATCHRFGVEPGRFLVALGAVSARKNVITLVRAMGDLGGDGLPLVIVGPDGHGAETVDAAIRQLDGHSRVVRTGLVSDADAAALVSGAAVLLHPALSEGFGFVPLEAMAAGTPVIAARRGSVPEVTGDAALLLDDPTEPAAWAAAVAGLLADERSRHGLTEDGKRRAAEFSWDNTASRMLELYVRAAEV